MMKRLLTGAVLFLLTLGIGGLWTGCMSNPMTPLETEVVLRGYLYANEPVTDIQLTLSNPIGSSDSTYPPIMTASVALVRGSVRYELTADAARPGYYISAGNNLAVATGDLFKIEVSYEGTLVTAQTEVPPKPEGLSMSATTIHFTEDSIQTPRGYRVTITSVDTVRVIWSNPLEDYYYLVFESLDSARTLIREEFAGQFGGDPAFGRRFISQPTNQSSYRLNPNDVQYTGKHVLKLYRVNKEYADLYRSRMQDSRALNEPLTNVTNGLGVFSAFASESMEFTVTLNE